MTISEIAEVVLPPKFSNRTSNINELKKSVKFADMLSDIINKQPEENKAVYQPREDIIAALNITPFTKRCRRCSRIIESGDYCQDCAKELTSSKYTLSDDTTKEDKHPYFKIEQQPMPSITPVQIYENSAEGKVKFLKNHNASNIKENTAEYNEMIREYCIEFYKNFSKGIQEKAKQEIKKMLQDDTSKDKTYQAPALDIGR